MSDRIKLNLAIIAIILGLSAYVVPGHWLDDNPQVSEQYRLYAVLISIVIAIALFWFTTARIKFVELIKSAKNEIVKVVWPTKQEAMTFTGTVVAFSLAVAFYSWLIDKGVELVLYDLILSWK